MDTQLAPTEEILFELHKRGIQSVFAVIENTNGPDRATTMTPPLDSKAPIAATN